MKFKFNISHEYKFVNYLLLIVFILFLFLPFGFSFSKQSDKVRFFNVQLPECAIHRTTGFKCPTCGLTRSISALYHENLHSSLYYNKAGILLVIYFLLQTLLRFIPIFFKKKWVPWFDISQLILSFVFLKIYFFV
ncbi:MAG: DUF2752 domain-containing protein [Desulfobacterales bacterium]|nr:DUF2752 domain-containing protein [Desulfobacterales bacterium]